jgi:serine/threonine-protein kinase HipA
MRCPITYSDIDHGKYSIKGLGILARQLKKLEELAYNAEEQRQEAVARAGKMSVQGVQYKLSAVLNVSQGRFDIVNGGGRYILKPQSNLYAELPQNEDLTMRLATIVGIKTPLHGMVYSKDGSLTYFIKRFDRVGHGQRLPLEDFAQLAGESRDTKYDFSMEKLVGIIDRYCTFPAIEKAGLFRLTLFNFLVGNEDMHLKNFSLITEGNIVRMSPAYDLLNTTIAMKNAQEEMALPLQGKKRGLTYRILVDYFGRERLQLTDKVISQTLHDLQQALGPFEVLLGKSFLSPPMQDAFRKLLIERAKRLNFR